MKKLFLTVSILFLALTCFSVEFSNDYIGLDFEFQKNDIVGSVMRSDYLSDNTIDLMFTYGPQITDPFRFRIGTGCHDLANYYGSLGVQAKILEFLNNANGRIFGVYAAADFKLGMDYIDANLAAEVFVPVNAFSGLQFGIGINHELSPFVSLSYSGGLYPMQISQ
jgi:hypothetical protein